MNQPTNANGITLLGLGPGDPEQITLEAWNHLKSVSECWLRTKWHPCVPEIEKLVKIQSFDEFYDRAETFEQVYAAITDAVIGMAEQSGGVTYAVPGNPFVAEATCQEIAKRAKERNIPIRIIHGISFIEPVLAALKIDPFPQTTLIDALEIASAHALPYPTDRPAILGQLYSRAVAADVKLVLMDSYPPDHPVTLLHSAGTRNERVSHIPLFEIDRDDRIDVLTSLYIPALPIGRSFESFHEIIAHLRAPDGCPWDREQTHLTLRKHLLEETYEALDALDRGNLSDLKEELGDILLQVVLHAQIATENEDFTMADVISGIAHKIIHRHPHVFGDWKVDGVDHVLSNWEKIKEAERVANGDEEKSLLDGVSPGLPALAQAWEVQERAARVGFDWNDIDGVIEKIREELVEYTTADTLEHQTAEMGDLLFALVNLARWKKIDAESALRGAIRKFRIRFQYIENQAKVDGRRVSDLSFHELNTLWEAAKALE